MNTHIQYLNEAYNEAQKSLQIDEVPVGSVVVYNNEIIGRGHNLRESKMDIIGHAEIVAMREACLHQQSWRLTGCVLYVTLEPCAMCTGAIIQSRIDKLVFGALDEKFGCILSQYTLLDDNLLGTKIDYEYLNDERCSKILSDYFRNKR